MPAGLEHGRVSVDRLQILRLLRGNQEDYAPGDSEYTVHMIVGIRFQKFHCFSVQVPVLWTSLVVSVVTSLVFPMQYVTFPLVYIKKS